MIQTDEIKGEHCTVHGWDEVSFLHSNLHGAVFWIYDYNSVDNTPVFLLLLNTDCTMSKLLFSHSVPQEAGWEWERGQESSQLGQLTQTGKY